MRKKLLTVGTIAVVTISGAFFTTDYTYAQPSLQDIQKEKKEVKNKLSKAEQEIADILYEIKDINEELNQLQFSLDENREQLEKTEVEINTYEKEIEKLQEEIDIINEEIEKRNEILKQRISSYQDNGGNIQYLEVFLGSKDFMDFITRASAVNQITNADMELITEQEEAKALVEVKQTKVEEKLEEKEELLEELEAIETEILEQKSVIEDGKKELEAEEKKLQEKKSKLKSKDSKLSQLEAEIRDAMNPAPVTAQSNTSSNSAESQYSGGKFAWPTSGGYISSPMGTRWGRPHSGIDIARTDRSTSPPIYAAESGTVESAGSRNGYGNTVIINHGNGVKTLYAHMASINVSNGQKVSRGQQIGIMGATGNSTGIHLHFEVHVNGSVQNPVNYLR
ncbi:MAG TPA: peptidoglycan DD-metalloendopeptidase family protein [Pseudogracilibacillus sp.]|nr:peptidoglycan DD-metalloendopeptidase family protein [Pseudogracilibacillus sp.]